MMNPGSIILFTNNILSHFNDSPTQQINDKGTNKVAKLKSVTFFICSVV